MSASTSMTLFDGVSSKFNPDALKKHVFTTAIDADGKRVGWVGLGDALDLNFDFGIDQGNLVGFSLRIDSRSASAAAISIQLAEAIREKEASGEKIRGQDRKDLKEAITSRLISQAPFIPALVDCLWDLENGRLLVSSTSDKVLQTVLGLFQTTFGISPEPVTPQKDMSEIFAEICREGQYKCGEYTLSPYGSASLATSGQEEDKSQVAVQNNLVAVASALGEGLKIQKVRLVATTEKEPDTLFDFTIDSSLAISGLKLPKAEKGAEIDAEFLLKTDICLKVASIVEKLASI